MSLPHSSNSETSRDSKPSGDRPIVLVVDDLHGRSFASERNLDRDQLCYRLRLNDVTPTESEIANKFPVSNPIADAVFIRGQRPIEARVGDFVVNDAKSVLEMVGAGWQTSGHHCRCWSMVLLDLCFYTGEVTQASNDSVPGMPEGLTGDDDPNRYFGLTLLKKIHEAFPWMPIVVHSTMPRQDVSKAYSRDGVAFLARPETDEGSVADNLDAIIQRHGLIEDPAGEILGRSYKLLSLLRKARLISRNDADLHILMRGETGSGKELLARYINRQGNQRTDKKMVIVNSPALSSELFASQLFGIRKGAATAVTEQKGLIQKADGGSLFLDEIKDMLPQVQAGILRVLEDGVVSRVGEESGLRVKVRFLSATNANIEALIETQRFRRDLLVRLRSGGEIELPPLRERAEDVLLLAERFKVQALASNPTALKREIDESVQQKLAEYSWPGNIRELRNCIFEAVNHHPDVEHLLPEHVVFSSVAQVRGHSTNDDRDRIPSNTSAALTARPPSLNEVVEILEGFHFEDILPTELSGQFPAFEAAYAKFAIRYLKAALLATRRTTLEYPEGKIQYHPAMKLMLGDQNLKAAQAADRIKKLFRLAPDAITDAMSDPLLTEVHEKCVSSRRSTGG